MQVQSKEELHALDEKIKVGRPRSENSRRAILDSTRRLLTHISVRKLSIEAIAKKAGVGKTTIYRWWPNKSAVIMEAVFSQPGFANILPQSANATKGITSQIEKLIRQLGGKQGRIVADIMAEAQNDTESVRSFVATFLQDRYNALATVLDQGRQNGEFDPNMDIDTAIDLILGPIFFRLLSGQALDSEFEKNHTAIILKAL